jgi:hypothetical protein
MINTHAEVYEALYYGDEMMIEYHQRKLFIQGWDKNNLHYLEVVDWEGKTDEETYVFESVSVTREERVKSFQKAKIFEGKTLSEVWDDAEWIDVE